MLNALQDLTLVVVAFTMVPALAHALELPGKMRLTKDVYFEVQHIYYPGFTVAGIFGPLSILLMVWLLFLLPRGTGDFWSALAALCGIVAMEAIYWTVIHPVNKVWVKGLALTGTASGFFGFGRRHPDSGADAVDWTALRNRWEYAHAVRAGLGFLTFVALVIGHG